MRLGLALLFTAVLPACGKGGSDTAFSKPVPTVEAVHEGRGVEAWAVRLEDPDAVARMDAINALLALGPAGQEALAPGLPRLLGDADRDVRFTAVVAAGRSRGATEAVAGAVVAALSEGAEPGIRRAARDAAVRLGAPAVPALRARLSLKEEGAAAEAAALLGAIGADAAPAVPDLVAALSSDDVSLQDTAGEALGAIGSPAVEGLARALASPKPEVAALAAHALGKIGPAAAPAAARLAAALHRSESIRSVAADALVALGSAARPALEDASKDPDERVSSAAKDALSRLR